MFYICEYNFYFTRVIINNLEKRKPQAQIYIMGTDIELIVKNYSSEIDFDIALFQHEHIALEKLLIDKQDITEVQNIAFKKKNELVYTNKKDYVYTLDDLGLPYSDGIIPPQEAPNTGLITSLGCIGRCLFCSYNKKRRFIVHKIENVIKELDYISQFVKGEDCDIRFFDDCFSVSSKRTRDLLEAMAERNYNFRFWCCIRGDIITDEILQLMSKLNFNKVVIGLETASEHVMEKLGKIQSDMKPDAFLNMLKERFLLARCEGISPVYSINFGLPYEKIEDANMTLKFVINNKAELSVSPCFMTCFPGSEVFERSEQYGVEKQSSPVRLPYRTYYPNYNVREVFDVLDRMTILKENVDGSIHAVNGMLVESITNVLETDKLSASFDSIIVDEAGELPYDFINKNLDINGTIIHRISELSVTSKYFCDNRKMLKFDMPVYDTILQEAYRHCSYMLNHEFVKNIGDNLYWQHNNQYLRGINKVSVKDAKFIYNMDIPIKETECGYLFQKFELDELDNMNIKNVCRFSGKCSLCQMRQVYIKEDDVYTCCTEDKIGKTGDSYSQLVEKVSEKFKERQKERKCESCDFIEWCSQCMYPVEGEQYCEFQQRNKKLIQYLHIITEVRKLVHARRNLFSDGIKVYWRNIDIPVDKKCIGLKSNVCFVEGGNYCFVLFLTKKQSAICKSNEGKTIKLLINGKKDVNIPDTYLMHHILENDIEL